MGVDRISQNGVMPNWSYDEAVKRRLRVIEQEKAQHRLVAIEGGESTMRIARCGCGMTEELWKVRMHLDALEMDWALPPGVTAQ